MITFKLVADFYVLIRPGELRLVGVFLREEEESINVCLPS